MVTRTVTVYNLLPIDSATMSEPRNPHRENIQALSENELRQDVLLPLLRRTPSITQVTDVHGTSERGLDIVFASEDGVRKNWYGLQLKTGDISGGGSGKRTVKTIIDQLELAKPFKHPVCTPPAGKYKIDYFVVATSGKISATARDEITQRLVPVPVEFWDLSEIVRRAKAHFPEVLQTANAELADYLKAVKLEAETLDSLDQVPGVAKHTLSEVFVEPLLRRRIDPTLASERNTDGARSLSALELGKTDISVVIIGEQDEGKTAILRMIASSLATSILEATDTQAPLRIPVLLRSQEVVKKADLLEATASVMTRAGAKRRAETILQSGSLTSYLLLLDGFSELPKEDDKAAVAEAVNVAIEAYEAKLLVAGRPDDFLQPSYFNALRQFMIQPFDQPQVSTLVRNWTKDLVKVKDVAERLVGRVRQALQLPGSPIPAIIGVMLYEKERKFITNTADAVDRYMVIRLGRYAHEMGLPFEVDWARKQDLLGEIAFAMVEEDLESIEFADAESMMGDIYTRLGEKDKSKRAIEELVDAGVLLERCGELRFYRTAFRDFFAAHHLHTQGTGFEDFFMAKLFHRKWGHTLVFAAGLRRRNSALLERLNARVKMERDQLTVGGGQDFLYGSYLLGRILSNSEFSDHGAREEVLHTTVRAAGISADLLGAQAVAQFGNVGNVLALVGTEHTLFVAVGVPWLEQQIRTVMAEPELTDEERYLIGSLYTSLGCEDWVEVFDEMVRRAQTPRVVVALSISARVLSTRQLKGPQAEQWRRALLALDRKRRRFGSSISEAVKFKDRILELEAERIRRLEGTKRKGGRASRQSS